MEVLLSHSHNALFLDYAILRTSPGRLYVAFSCIMDRRSVSVFSLATHTPGAKCHRHSGDGYRS